MIGTVFDIAHWAGHDGPGIRSIVFLKGCPLRCIWCHSPESQHLGPELVYLENKCILCGRCVAACPNGARIAEDGAVHTDRERCDQCGACAETCYSEALQLCGRTRSADDVIAEVAQDAVFYRNSGGGVTISGGEPLAQAAFATAIARGCHEQGIHVALETCGHVAWPALFGIAPHVDLFLYDLKIMDPERHRQHTGRSSARIHDNLTRLAALGADIQIRVPLIPGHTDDDDNLRAICHFTRDLGLQRIAFLPFNPATGAKYAWLGRDCALASREQQDDARLQAIRELGESFGLDVQMGG
jgi:pyruvate formate lyase activating enzyme